MKRLLLSLSALFLLSRCGSSDSDPIHKLVIQDIKSNLGEENSYSPLEWGEILPVYGKKRDMPAMVALRDSISGIRTQENTLFSKRFDSFSADSIHQLELKLLKLQLRYDLDSKGTDSTTVVGYRISHKYKAKNKYGALENFEHAFYLNKAKDSIVGPLGY